MDHTLTTTAFTLDGYSITRNLGVVRGIMVRSRSIFGTIGGSLQTIIGGNISLFTSLCEKTRSEAFELMLGHAQELGANAVVAARQFSWDGIAARMESEYVSLCADSRAGTRGVR